MTAKNLHVVVVLKAQSIVFNTFKPNGISHCNQLEQSISVLRDVG